MQILTILNFTQIFSRISYQIFRAIFVVYLISQMQMSDSNAYAIYSIFVALSYITPIMSGMFADAGFGAKNLLVQGTFFLFAGNVLLWKYGNISWLFFFSLGLIAQGMGFIKNNVVHFFSEYAHKKHVSKDFSQHGFKIMYLGIKISIFFSTALPALLFLCFHDYDYLILSAVIFSMIAFIFLLFHYQSLNKHANSTQCWRNQVLLFIANILFSGSMGLMIMYHGYFSYWVNYFFVLISLMFFYLIYKSNQKRRLIAAFLLIFSILLFNAIQIHLTSFFIVFYERNVCKNLFGFGFEISNLMMQATATLIAIVIGYFLSHQFLHSFRSFIFGHILNNITCLLFYLSCFYYDAQFQTSLVFYFINYTLLGVSVLHVSPFVMHYLSILAPKKMLGFMTGMQLVGIAAGSMIGGYCAKIVALPVKWDAQMALVAYQSLFGRVAVANWIFFIMCIPIFYFIYNVIEETVASKQNQKD